MRLTFEIQSKITLPLQPQIQDLTLSQLSQTTHDFKITQITCIGRENKKQLSLAEGKKNLAQNSFTKLEEMSQLFKSSRLDNKR